MAGGRTTAGWFLLGLPFLLGLGLIVSLLFSLISRCTRPAFGWLCLAVVFTPLIVSACSKTTPAARLRAALTTEPPVGTSIYRIEQYDSFNDGSTIIGVCSASPEYVQTLLTTHSLEVSGQGGFLNRRLRDEPIPEEATVYSNNELIIWYDAEHSRLYFYRRIGQRPER
jgi:hypothetical protein